MAGNASSIRAGRAYYELFTQNNPLVKGLKAAENLVKGSVASVAKGTASAMSGLASSLGRVLTSPITGLVAALAPLAAGHLFAGMSTELVDISRRTGASTEALQTLGYAAKRTGQDLGAIEGVLTTVRDKITEAARGSEDAQLAFGRLGLSFLKLSQMRPDERLRAIADKLNSIPNPAIRAAMATELLGSADMLPTLQSLAQMEARAKRLGLVLGGETVAAGKQLGNALEDLHSNLMATVSVIGAKISPAISELIEKWVEMSGHTRAWIADNTAMFSSAAALWAFLKLQWAKGSAYILEQFGIAGRGMESLWVDTQAALEGGWERFKHAADHSLGWLADTAKSAFLKISQLALTTVQTLATAFSAISDDMGKALHKAANDLARLMAKLNVPMALGALKDLGAELLDQDNPELQKKLAALEADRQAKQAALMAKGGPNQAAQIAALQKEYDDAVAKATAAAPKGPAEGAGVNGKPGPPAGANHQAGFNAAIQHVGGIGAVDVKTKEGFASVAASLRQSQLAQQAFSLQKEQYLIERDTRDRITKILVVGKK